MTIDVDNVFEPDPSKLRLLIFDDPVILINSTSVSRSNTGFISLVSNNDNVSMNFTVHVINPFTGNIASLDDVDGYYYILNMSILPSLSSLQEDLNFVVTNNGTKENNISSTIDGNIVNISSTKMEFLVRASISMYQTDGTFVRTDNTDLYCYFEADTSTTNFKWNDVWLNGLLATYIDGYNHYSIGTYDRGEVVNIPMEITNPPDDYTITFDAITSGFSISDMGLKPSKVSNGFNFIGITSVGYTPGTYDFKVTITDSSDPTNTGDPSTSDTIFRITLTDVISSDSSGSSIITWTTNTNLGYQYESYPSFFSVNAYSLYNDTITYSIISTSINNLTIDSTTGMLIGTMPYVYEETSFTVTVRASDSSGYSDKTFNIFVEPLFYSSNVFSLSIPVTDEIRRKIAVTSWDTSVVTPDMIYRLGDENFGRLRNQNIYLVSGLIDSLDTLGYWNNTLSDTDPNYGVGVDLPSDSTEYKNYSSCFLDKLRNYHHPYDLTISDISYLPVYDLKNNHICDVVYYSLTDPNDGVGGFDTNDYEVLVTDTKKSNNSIPIWNMENTDTRIFPASVRNCRLDLIETTNRIDTPTYAIRPNATPGIGLYKNEGLPMSMLNPSSSNSTNVGFTLMIELLYVLPDLGAKAVRLLKNSSYYDLVGETFTVDRYIITRNTTTKIHFDYDESVDTETTFDCTSRNSKIDKTTGTWFDGDTTPYQQVIKFPPGDIN